MKNLTEHRFVHLTDRGGHQYSDLALVRCVFDGCAIGLTEEASNTTTVRRSSLMDCTARSCDCGPVVLDEVEIGNLRTTDMLIAWGAMFRHVTFRGQCGRIKVNRQASIPVGASRSALQAFDIARQRFYDSVDWAIDISDAEFEYFENSAVPAHLIRYDATTQGVVRPEAALRQDWRSRMHASAEPWLRKIEFQLGPPIPAAIILTIPSTCGIEEKATLMDGLKSLRDLGIVTV